MLPEAIKLFLKAKDIYEKLGDIENIQMVSNYIADIYIAIDEYDKALDLLLNNLKYVENNDIEKEYGIYPIGLINMQIGIVYRNKKEYDLALKHYNKSLNIYRELNALNLLASVYNNLGIIYLELGDYYEALDYYDSSLTYSKQVKNFIAISNTKNNIGNIYMQLNDFKKAQEYCLESYRWADSVEFFNLIHASAGNFANISKNLGDK